ncbi:UPF0481 protein At3g47200-like [Dioscorea cayenensis subsp. rotundata]|uniref:UPF0481 protein At3g47200-like n=1 Tax=Dioscorea cayennensis subsp. rotundata TaxID=55577 RepID=A0AB40CKG5_DIOCR|nr:UPF0481 protein At3g47200-like [Dioscorea cayenensis subsp. rotundata]
MQSSIQDAAGGHIQEVTVEIQDDTEWIKKVTNDINECREKTQGRWKCSIFKVPEDIRQCNMKAYDPLVVTIGPYHYNKSEDRTVLAMQAHKWHCVRRLLSRHTKSRRKATDLLGKCLMEMQRKDADVRGCYSEDLHHLSANDLALIMLLDGCFVIHVLLRHNKEKHHCCDMITLDENEDDADDGGQQQEEEEEEEEEEDNNIVTGHKDMVVLDVMGKKQIDLRVSAFRVWTMMLFDLVKVENQIPFIMIQTLFNELKTPRDKNINLVKIAHDLLKPIHPASHYKNSVSDQPLPQSNDVHHLLHLFHSTIVPSAECLKINSMEQEMDYEWIPSATELQLAGVEFVSKKGNTHSFLDISFKNGTIEIPQISLYDDTETLFRNLIAFEQCYPNAKYYLTGYVFFMDYMINTTKDVELFELKGILINYLGTADAATTLINQLCHNIYDPGNNYLLGSILQVQNHYKSRWHKWRARLMRDYFDNPWAIVSLVAALILLLLTVQQSFFTAYAYFRPPKN